jgi:hypothetical protein
MKLKSLIAVIIISVLNSCGPKVGKDSNAILKDTKTHISKIESNKNLKSEVTEGALTDAEGFNDIGTFKYTVYFDENTKELFKIKNVEKTSKTTTETYYFQENELVYLKSVSGNDTKILYLKKGRVVSETNTTSDDQQLLLAKAERFQKGFKKSY